MTRASPPPEIRWHTADRAELRALFELAEDSPRQLAAYFDAGRVLVAVEHRRVVGHLQLTAGAAPDQVELKSLAVAEDRQGRGIGRALVARAIEACRAEAATTMLVATAAADIGNLRFYQRLGFRMLRVERDAFTAAEGYPDGLFVDGIPLRDRIWFSLEL